MKKRSIQIFLILAAALFYVVHPCRAGKLSPACTSFQIRGPHGAITLDFSNSNEKQVRKQPLSTGFIFDVADDALDTTGGRRNVRYSFAFVGGLLSSVSSDTLLAVKRDTADRYLFDRAGDLLALIGGEEIYKITPDPKTLKTYDFPNVTCGKRYLFYRMELIRQDKFYVVRTTALML